MNLEKEHKNGLLGRKEVEFTLKSEASPAFAAVTKDVAEHFKTSEEQVVVKKILGSYGSSNYNVVAHIYESVEAKNKAETKRKVKKEAGK